MFYLSQLLIITWSKRLSEQSIRSWSLLENDRIDLIEVLISTMHSGWSGPQGVENIFFNELGIILLLLCFMLSCFKTLLKISIFCQLYQKILLMDSFVKNIKTQQKPGWIQNDFYIYRRLLKTFSNVSK